MQISEAARISIMAKKAAKQYGERKQKVQQIMSSTGLSVVAAIEIYKARLITGEPTDEQLADLARIGEELTINGTATA